MLVAPETTGRRLIFLEPLGTMLKQAGMTSEEINLLALVGLRSLAPRMAARGA